MPLFVMVLFGIVILGIGIFYQQQITNAAREAARYAALHSATAQCPTVSRLPPVSAYRPQTYDPNCDAPAAGWPRMTVAGRSAVFGLPTGNVRIAACWSGYVDGVNYDAPPPNPDGYDFGGTGILTPVSSTWSPCTIGGQDPALAPSQIPCTAGIGSTTVDTASDLSEKSGVVVANQVTAYACYNWQPPLAGFLLIPSNVILRGVVSEPIQRQQ